MGRVVRISCASSYQDPNLEQQQQLESLRTYDVGPSYGDGGPIQLRNLKPNGLAELCPTELSGLRPDPLTTRVNLFDILEECSVTVHVTIQVLYPDILSMLQL